jgi:hypothetical protein
MIVMNLARYFSLAFLIPLTFALQAQEGFTTAGGDISGADGAVSYSLGQVAYQYLAGPGGSLSQGVQHSFEGMMVGVEYDRFISGLSLYPNPVSTEFIIDFGGALTFHDQDAFSYRIHDLTGRQEAQGSLTADQTKISARHLQPGMYLVSIFYETSRITSHKIIKAE